ncbi:MAG: polysaccharide biosynthesis protein [Elusimicrobia bacterium]|nr:MAG: polysaccharide biosynthesis protein [Elusimicrobiota bacterium]KAF0154089.1 MAG: polysaccharide biosynthesis protein [Elusimicrobiota bacterium]
MKKDIGRLGGESLIYGLSTVAARLLTFLLMPFYTHYLPPAGYGVVAAVFSYIAFLNIVYHYGLDQSYMRHRSEDAGRNRAALPAVGAGSTATGRAWSSSLACLLASTAFLTLLMCLFPSALAGLAGIGADSGRLVLYAAAILALDTLSLLPFAELRMRHKALRYALVRTASIALNVALNVYFLAFRGMGVEGVFLANILSSALSLLLLSDLLFSAMPSFDRGMARRLLSFALPLLPAGLGAMAVQVIDRPIMLALSGEAAVGLYQAGYRLGIFMMLIVSMFDAAWRPFFLERADKPEAPPVFARVLTYFTALAAWTLVGVSLLIEDAVKADLGGFSLIHPDYWAGLRIVPVVLAAYLLNGVYVNFLAPVIIAKRTGEILKVTLAGAAASVAANFLLIPPFGAMGAAAAALLAYAVMAGLMYRAGRGLMQVPYEWGRLSRLAAVTCLFLAGHYAFGSGAHGPAAFGVKAAAALLFPAALWLAGFFLPGEKAEAAALLSRFTRKKPAA